MIEELNPFDLGSFIYYGEEKQKGKIKSYNNEKKIAFVVYSCNNDWNNYLQYTAEATNYEDLSF